MCATCLNFHKNEDVEHLVRVDPSEATKQYNTKIQPESHHLNDCC